FAHPPTGQAFAVLDPNTAILSVFGTAGADTISLNTPVGTATTSVTLNGSTLNFSSVRSIVVYGFAGGDTITDNVNLPATLDGGAGNDSINGGPGADYIVGGSGNDTM